MFRYIAVGGGLFLLLIWVGPMLVQAARRMKNESAKLYDAADDDQDEAD